jgi:(2Fe-2S) ferredoxin
MNEPFYQHHIFCCQNLRETGHPRGCCAQGGAIELLDYMKSQVKALKLNGPGKVRVNKAGCLDRCELGPVIVIYPEEVWYHIETKADIDRIITEHLKGGKVVSDLQLDAKQKRL